MKNHRFFYSPFCTVSSPTENLFCMHEEIKFVLLREICSVCFEFSDTCTTENENSQDDIRIRMWYFIFMTLELNDYEHVEKYQDRQLRNRSQRIKMRSSLRSTPSNYDDNDTRGRGKFSVVLINVNTANTHIFINPNICKYSNIGFDNYTLPSVLCLVTRKICKIINFI